MKKLRTTKSKINGTGLFTTEPIKKGERIDYIKGPIVVFRSFTPQISKRMKNWIGVGTFSWINTDNSQFRYINHSCDPNTMIIGRRTVVALRNIAKGEELTMDYTVTEAEPGWRLGDTCNCGSRNCRKNIGPITTLSKTEFNKLLPRINKQFREVYKNNAI